MCLLYISNETFILKNVNTKLKMHMKVAKNSTEMYECI